MEYEFGLKCCDNTPQEYKLSHILAGYRNGFCKENGEFNYMGISVKDSDVKSDGKVDFMVPARYRTFPSLSHFMKNVRLAWKVLTGRASILYYE